MTDNVYEFMKSFEERIPDSEIFMVGGCVRDLIMGNEPNDYDFATNIDVDTIEKHFDCVNIGASKDFGIVSVQFGGESFETCQYRSELGYTDSRHPDTVTLGVSIENDSTRRDFSMNAMYMAYDGKIHDFHKGRKDIENQVIRAVGNAKERIEEDALRILRAIRFAVTFNFTLDFAVEVAIRMNSESIRGLSQERITGELIKVASKGGPTFFRYFKALENLELMEIVFPEIEVMKNYRQFWLHHPEGGLMRSETDGIVPLTIEGMEAGTHTLVECGDVYTHVKSVMSMIPEDADEFVVLSALWHDIGKPITAKLSDSEFGTFSFKRHEYKGVAVFEELAKKRKIGGKLRECINFCIAQHMNMNNKELSKKSTIITMALNPFFDVLAECSRYDDMSRNVNSNILYVEEEFDANLQKFINARDTYVDEREFKSKISKFIDGNKVMNHLNIKPSKKVGEVIGEVTQYLIDNDFNLSIDEVDRKILSLK